MIHDLDQDYFAWLYAHMDPLKSSSAQHSWWELIIQLHSIPYRWHIRNDDNRAADGLTLRDEFCDLVGSWEGTRWIHGKPCSVLEMLIALAKRVSFTTEDSPLEADERSWLHHFLENLALLKYNDEAYMYDAEWTKSRVREKVRVFLDRDYEPNGRGGLFPLLHPKTDQRMVEVWYQLAAYLIEKDDN